MLAWLVTVVLSVSSFELMAVTAAKSWAEVSASVVAVLCGGGAAGSGAVSGVVELAAVALFGAVGSAWVRLAVGCEAFPSGGAAVPGTKASKQGAVPPGPRLLGVVVVVGKPGGGPPLAPSTEVAAGVRRCSGGVFELAASVGSPGTSGSFPGGERWFCTFWSLAFSSGLFFLRRKSAKKRYLQHNLSMYT